MAPKKNYIGEFWHGLNSYGRLAVIGVPTIVLVVFGGWIARDLWGYATGLNLRVAGQGIDSLPVNCAGRDVRRSNRDRAGEQSGRRSKNRQHSNRTALRFTNCRRLRVSGDFGQSADAGQSGFTDQRTGRLFREKTTPRRNAGRDPVEHPTRGDSVRAILSTWRVGRGNSNRGTWIRHHQTGIQVRDLLANSRDRCRRDLDADARTPRIAFTTGEHTFDKAG